MDEVTMVGDLFFFHNLNFKPHPSAFSQARGDSEPKSVDLASLLRCVVEGLTFGHLDMGQLKT